MSLKQSASKGLLWTFLDTVVAKGAGIVASILLARLLSPREFGLMGMIYVFTGISMSIVDSGLTASLIRSKDVDEVDYSTIFYTNLALGLLLYAIIYSAAPYIALFYNEAVLVAIIRIYALMFIIAAFSAVQNCLFTKKLEFKRLMLLNIPGIVLGAALGVGMAFYNFGVWSIIVMQLSTQAVFSVMLWLASPWKPHIVFSVAKLKKHFNFGYKLTLSGILNATFDNMYNVVIGKFFSTNVLGQFERARSFSVYPTMVLTAVVGKVTYPLLSSIQDERERLTLVYKQILQFVFFVAAPIMLGLAAISKPLILLVLGQQWEQAAIFFQILCVSGMLYPVHAFNLNLLKVYGRSDWFLKLEVIKKIIIAVAVAIAFPFGIYTLVWSAVVCSLLALVVNTYYTNLLISYNLWEQFKDIWVILLVSALTFLIMYLGQNYFFESSLSLKVLIPSIAGITFYLSSHYLLKTPSLFWLWQFKEQLR